MFFIDSCYETSLKKPDTNEAVNALVDRAVALYDGLIREISHPDQEGKHQAHFKSLRDRVWAELQELRGELRKLDGEEKA